MTSLACTLAVADLLGRSRPTFAQAPPAPADAPAAPSDPAAPANAVDPAAAPNGVDPATGLPLTEEQADELAAREFEATLHFQTGTIAIRNDLADIALPEGFRYLAAADASRVLEVWGNPPDSDQLGMIVPANVSLFADESFAVILTYEDDGHVSDDDAEDIDFGEILTQMKTATREENPQRAAQGFPEVTIEGWAETPHYDAREHRIYWAKDLVFSGSEGHTVNYDVRVLGRVGVLSLNAVTSLANLATVRREMPRLMRGVRFRTGNRYADFDEDHDRMAEYGVAALVAGGIAQKAGIFKILLGLLVAGKKLVVVAVVAIGAFLKKVFGGNKTEA